MQIHEPNPTPPPVNLTGNNPESVDLDHPLNPSPANVLTCVEHRENFHRIQAAVHNEFHPKSDFQRLLADDLAETLWAKTRLSTITTHILDHAIQSSWHEVTQRFPAADSALRTHLAWEEIATKPAQLRATDTFTRTRRRALAEIRFLTAHTGNR